MTGTPEHPVPLVADALPTPRSAQAPEHDGFGSSRYAFEDALSRDVGGRGADSDLLVANVFAAQRCCLTKAQTAVAEDESDRLK